jgi:hypothetical protein
LSHDRRRPECYVRVVRCRLVVQAA